ncbi:Peptidyl-prolyl cis-trans isomerase-like 3 [Senna tora]|uniref:Peptidyl-prolyl cis-trans isomerase-like 3 n=1 Tax=Senna tora TaxID=362788 RepID=A0A834TQF3_9FABA|nr:Peptidyl-prolyl cis-trans isomerase-like 3 [Senna tora]
MILLLMGIISCCMVYLFITVVFRPSSIAMSSAKDSPEEGNEDLGSEEGECCRGIEHLELWGDAVKWGTEFRFNSSEDCCNACKAMCRDDGGSCLCNSWVFCGDREACGPRFGECWLKRQKDALNPDRRDSGNLVMWTSGFVFGKREGIVGLETEYGILRVRLLPDCAPQSVASILELLALQHCAGCHFYRAESRGSFWDSNGNHKKDAAFGPPFALIEGTFEAHGSMFRDIPKENCPTIRKGSVAWVGSGPEFFISLANHNEWKKDYTVFGSVLSEDMAILEKISQLPTSPEVWSNINVSVLEKPVLIRIRRINTKP